MFQKEEKSTLLISLLIGFFISLLYLFGLMSSLELKLGYDSSFLFTNKYKPNQSIKIIGIDQKSIDMIGSFPWRRDTYSNILDHLGNEPKVIGLDIILSDVSKYPEDDILLEKQIGKSNNVVLPISIEPDIKNKGIFQYVYPLEEFHKNAKAVGLVNFFQDIDGILRKSPKKQIIDETNEEVNIFGYEVVKNYLDKSIVLPDEVYLNYHSYEEDFEIYSFFDVYSKQIPAETFKDSIVLIGSTAEGLKDRVATPIGPMDGVVYHAQLISNMINRDYITPIPKVFNIILIFLTAIGTFLIWKKFTSVNQSFLVLLSALIIYLAHYILFKNNIWFSVVSIISTNSLTYISLILFSQLQISKLLKKELNNLIKNYENKSLQYKIYETQELKPAEENLNLDVEKIAKIAEIGNNLTIERSFLETLLNNIKISIVVTDESGKIILANPSSQEFFSNYKIVGKSIIKSFEFMPEVQTKLMDVYSMKKKSFPSWFYGETGSSMYKLTLITVDEKKNNDVNIICLIEDVTDWHQRVNTDGLTGLWNQRYFKEYLQKEIDKTKRYKTPLSVIMMDVDHFKSFNDTYGHQTGDIVLKTIAEQVKESARNTDITARYGGEEFSIVLPMTNEDGAKIFAERLRKRIEALKILDINGNIVRTVTSSLGVASYDGQDMSEFIENADTALYNCKDRGRNCVILFSNMDSSSEVEKVK